MHFIWLQSKFNLFTAFGLNFNGTTKTHCYNDQRLLLFFILTLTTQKLQNLKVDIRKEKSLLVSMATWLLVFIIEKMS